jgi:transposase
LVDHREHLVAERTRTVNRLRWHLHELDATWDPTRCSLTSYSGLERVGVRLAQTTGLVAEIAGELVTQALDLTRRMKVLERAISERVRKLAPTLLALPGVGALTAAKIVGETADVRRFKSKDAFARHNGTAPLPVWSANRERHRLSRSGNRQLNAAIHRIAVTQGRYHDEAMAFLKRREAMGNSAAEGRRALKRRLSDVVFRALLADAPGATAADIKRAA